jgi:hypothetical protein
MGSSIQVEGLIGSLPLAVLTQRCARTKYYTQRLGISIYTSGLYLVYRAEYAFPSPIQHVSVNHCCPNVFMAE